MQVNKKFIIDAEFANTRIDKWLKLQTKKFPQSFIEKLLRSGKVKINNKKIKSSYKLQLNDEAIVQFTYEEKKENEKFSYKASLQEHKEIKKNVVFENQDYLVLNKPSGISVQSGTKSPKNLIDILNKFSENKKFYLVHRIDKETSGIIIFASNRLFAQSLSEQFRNKQISKSYLAILHGSLSVNEGTLEHDLIFKEKNKIKTFKAETDFDVLSKNKDYTYVEAVPLTGRKHQIRQQFFKINNPIVGDTKYVNPHFNNNKHSLMLHSYKISFLYKGRKKTYKIDPPSQFKNLLKTSNL
jgi:23S rRNA pseudouridine955/2504/2580 synthase